ncbi:hypothetical protein F511_16575 [Dorcoceras hygrometricum]|uniref:Uncharacterized protein n=1 Tax=Dorcoceras hygrometricum TaxID=472368 RepID=A0A2Z7B3J0_9LAMI|nr:hypothetical protein F511_16575 [Dorcoceras hygrometricum]
MVHGHRNIDWKSYHADAIVLWNRKLRFVVDGERHGRSRQTEDDYMPWFERITVRVISPTVHGVGYIPMPYDLLLAGQSSTQHNFSTPSTHSQRSSSVPFIDPHGTQNPFIDPHATQQSFFDTQQPFMDTQQPFVDTQQPFAQDFQTPLFSNIQSFTDLLNVNLHQHVSHERDRNIVSPIPFPSYSGDQHNVDESESSVSGEQNANAENVEMGRGRRRRRPTRCGTGHHLYY